ncbi:hypothetical protein OF83DRAFT_1164480 [Amylostereum chailletii]|nr:hypothetical protein OF83DRAFT_1164480 [Amylostereum chailletii]
MSSSPIIVVTGANNGIGFGICRRLLFQLSLAKPTDATPKFERSGAESLHIPYPCVGLTLIMACRSTERAEAAKMELLQLFEEDVSQSELHKKDTQHVEDFRQNLELKIHKLDLASVQSVLHFADELKQTYPYVSHLICNAGVAPFLSINWWGLAKHLVADFMGALTNPSYNVQEVGLLSDDHLGWVWQCNVFGHYVLARSLESLLAASANDSRGPARVLWMSSLEALPKHFRSDDWQLVKTRDPYQASKYQIELVGAELDRRALQRPCPPVRHFVVHPGVVYTSIDAKLIGAFLHRVKYYLFYFVRLIGSIHHNITSWNGSSAAVHVALASLAYLPMFMSLSTGKVIPNNEVDEHSRQPPDMTRTRFHAVTTGWDTNSVAVSPICGWREHSEERVQLVDKCESLYHTFLIAERRTVD